MEKHERIVSIKTSVESSGGTEEEVADVLEMMSPAEWEQVEKLHQQLDKIRQAQIQAEQTMFIFKQFLQFINKS